MNSLLIWPVALPLAGGLLALLMPRWANRIGLSITAASLMTVMLVVERVASQGGMELALGGWDPGLGIALRADGLSTALLLMSALVELAVGIYASRYFSEPRRGVDFWPLWLMLVAALHALFLSGDLFNLYVTLELLGLAAVILAALGGGRDALQAALRYLTVGLLGSMAFLAGITLLYSTYGTLDMAALGNIIAPRPSTWVALTLMSAGLLIKSALFPMHFWLPVTHANAPAPVSAALSALVVKAAFYLLLRLWLDLFSDVVTPSSAWFVGLLGAGAVLWGSWQALQAKRLKLLAAYSTVAQIGYLFLFLPLVSAVPTGSDREILLGALALLALTHGFAKSAFFLAAGIIQQQAGHDRIAELGGTARTLPVTTFVLALSGIALIGLPPSGSFLAKWHLISFSVSLGQWLWLPVVAAGTLMSATYTFRLLGQAFTQGEGVGPALIAGRQELPAFLLALVATVAFGFGASYIWEFIAMTPEISGELR